VCSNGVCAAPTCNDAAKNGKETDVDCGGPVCGDCADGKACLTGGDCVSAVCSGGKCQAPTCNDGVKNGAETDKDCGGPACADCAAGLSCLAAGDCQSGICTAGKCAAPTCSDAVKNGSETGVDCGGSCLGCLGQACSLNSQCVSGFCGGGVCAETGCADGQREGFIGFPNIAACAGAWSVAGVKSVASLNPACGNKGGDDGLLSGGAGCSVADLCQVGWHVCNSAAEVASSAGIANACSNAALLPAQSFFITRQSGSGSLACDAVGNNDIFGCGDLGTAAQVATCSPLTRTTGSSCSALGGGWSCGAIGSFNVTEAQTVVKSSSARGGALCCRDLNP